MSATIPVPLPPGVPEEVHAFTVQQGVDGYLPALLEMTQRIFPNAPLAVVLESDPEIADDRHIVFEVDVTGMDEAEYLATRWRWVQELFAHCPAPHTPVFRLGMVMT